VHARDPVEEKNEDVSDMLYADLEITITTKRPENYVKVLLGDFCVRVGFVGK
jgi:hypothetical protein